MPRFIAFLRGINVGGHRVKMDRLRELFRVLDFADVETFIASGNVIFDATADDPGTLEAEIEDHLHRSLGFAVDTFIRTPRQLESILAHHPFTAAGPNDAEPALSIVFLKAPTDEAFALRLEGLCTADDEFHVHDRELYWLCRTRISESPAFAPLSKVLRGTGTMRNATTLRKLLARYREST